MTTPRPSAAAWLTLALAIILTFLLSALMASNAPPTVPLDSETPVGAALQHGPWRKRARLASGLQRIEQFLEQAGFDRAPWLVVAYAGGIGLWFMLAGRWQWLALLAGSIAVAVGAMSVFARDGEFSRLRGALIWIALLVAAGCATVWTKSVLVGAEPVARPLVAQLSGRVIEREEQPAQNRVRLIMATSEPGTGRPIRVRLNLPVDADAEGIAPGANVSLRARLVPPAAPLVPGGYNFARTAWFSGIAATGSVLGEVDVVRKGEMRGLEGVQRALSSHVRERLPGSGGSIAAAFASGDRGAIAPADEQAMRDSGLTHLLSISGLHVSAVIAAAYFISLRLLALWPWLALRVRLPLLAAATAAAVGIGYTLLTGAQVPTVRSCVGALLVLAALVLGREPLGMRMVAVAAFAVLVIWPEALVGPSFQMSFAAVIAIVALHGAGPVRAFLAPREEGLVARGLRQTAGLLLTGVVIEVALMPIGLYHFHRAGAYGALANVIAIPLTTFAIMPLEALALLLDLVGAGAPAWWLTGQALDALLALAHWVAAQPGAVTALPATGLGSVLACMGGWLWLALWQGYGRLWGLIPMTVGALSLAFQEPPDVLVSGDGRHVGITGEGEELLVLREGRGDYTRGTMLELAGMDGLTRRMDDWPGARCSLDFCVVSLRRGGRDWRLLISRGKDMVGERELAAACERVDIVISDRWLPRSCRPAWFKADRAFLERSGGLAIDLEKAGVRTVAESEGEHGWWRPARARSTRPQ